MNQNLMLAVLVVKGIITEDEANKLADHLNNKPQHSRLIDALAEARKVVTVPPLQSTPVPSHIGPEQAAEQAAAPVQPDVVDPSANEQTEDELKVESTDNTPGAMDQAAANQSNEAVSEQGDEGTYVDEANADGEEKPSDKSKKNVKKATDDGGKK